MKKFLPPIILVMGFCGFLAGQILWDVSHLGAQQIQGEKNKDQLFETLFQETKVTTVDKQVVELKSLKSPIVVVNFWASWCLPCLKEFPSLVEFKRKYGEKAVVLGVNGDEEKPEEAVEKISKKFSLDFLHVVDPRSEISDKFLVTTYPFTVIYVNGKVKHIASKNQNFMDKELLASLDSALSSK